MSGQQGYLFGEDFVLADDYRQTRQLRPAGPVRSQAEAHALHSVTRATRIEQARVIAVDHAQRYGTATIADVRARMPWLADSDESLTWLGSVFNCDLFEWTGQFVCVEDVKRNNHGKLVKVWRLRRDAA